MIRAEIVKWEESDCQEVLGDNNLRKVKDAVIQFRQSIFNQTLQIEGQRNPSENIPTQIQRVRLQGQEKCHFEGIKCTKFGGYTGDDIEGYCILKNKSFTVFPNSTQKFGYHEISLDLLSPKLIYTLGLGPCIAILMVGVGRKGEAKKAALMHEDYSSPKNSVTDMFNHSVKDELKDFSQIKFFLIGGNGGNEPTKKRFDIHKSEICELSKRYDHLINLNFSSDDLDSPNDQFRKVESNVFFSSLESSTYLWILQHNGFQIKSLKVTCVTGPELSDEKLDTYYREHILTKLSK